MNAKNGTNSASFTPGNHRPTVLFIGGLGRSGSTLLELSLATDRRVVSLGEVVHLWERSLLDNELCGCNVIFSRCIFWQSLGDIAYGGWSKVDANHVLSLKKRVDRTIRTPQLATGLGSKSWRDDVLEYGSYYDKLYKAAQQHTGAEVVVDSSKQASLPYVLKKASSVDLRVLHSVRDSRAVAYSWTKTVSRPEAQHDESSLMTRYSPPTAAVKWLQHNLVVEAVRLVGLPTLRMRYEDWVAKPESTVTSVLAFAGLQPRPNPHLTDTWVNLVEAHTCSGNPMRFTTGRVNIRKDDKWRTALPSHSNAVVTLLTAPLLGAYRYGRLFR